MGIRNTSGYDMTLGPSGRFVHHPGVGFSLCRKDFDASRAGAKISALAPGGDARKG